MTAVNFANRDERSSGLIDSCRGVITGSTFGFYEYNDGADSALTWFLTVKLSDEDAEEYGMETHEERYGLGSKTTENFSPSEDGEEPADEGPWIVPVDPKERAKPPGRRVKISNSSKFMQAFDLAVEEGGFPLDRVGDGDISGFIGADVQLERVKMKIKGEGLQFESGQAPTLLAITETYGFVDEKSSKNKGKSKSKKKKSKGSSRKKSKPKKSSKPTVDDDALASVVESIIEENDGEISKMDLVTSALSSLAEQDEIDTAAGVARINEDAFLSSREEWVFDSDDNTLYFEEEDED